MRLLALKPATPEHAPLILEQCRDLILRYEDLKQINLERVLAWLDKKIRENISYYTCVYSKETLVAFFSLREEETQVELDDFYVLEPYRNRGFGSEILEDCITKTQKPIYLYVFTANQGAIRLYERYGFVKTREVSPTRIIMTRCP